MFENNQKNKKLGLKSISLIMSILLWFYVVNQGSLITGHNVVEVELKYNNAGESYSVIGPEKVAVKLWGSFKEAGEIVAYVDLRGLSKGIHKLPVHVQPVKGAMFTSVNPDKVEVTLEELKGHIVPVNYEIKKNPPAGYALGEVITTPVTCMVKGQANDVDRVVTVVAPLDLSNSRQVASFKSALQARDAKGRIISQGVTLIPRMVEVYAVIEKKTALRKLPVKPQLSGSVAEGYRLSEVKIEPSEVTALGEQAKVDLLNEISTKPIEIKDKKESFSQEVDLVQPAGLIVKPSRVTINVKIDKTDKIDKINAIEVKQ